MTEINRTYKHQAHKLGTILAEATNQNKALDVSGFCNDREPTMVDSTSRAYGIVSSDYESYKLALFLLSNWDPRIFSPNGIEVYEENISICPECEKSGNCTECNNS